MCEIFRIVFHFIHFIICIIVCKINSQLVDSHDLFTTSGANSAILLGLFRLKSSNYSFFWIHLMTDNEKRKAIEQQLVSQILKILDGNRFACKTCCMVRLHPDFISWVGCSMWLNRVVHICCVPIQLQQ